MSERRFSGRTVLVTGAASGIGRATALRLVLEGAQLSVVPAEHATIFDNRYGPDGRVQFLYGRAAPLGPADVPAAWRAAPILHLGPIANEADPSIASVFPQALTVATPQGFFPEWIMSSPGREDRNFNYKVFSAPSSEMAHMFGVTFDPRQIPCTHEPAWWAMAVRIEDRPRFRRDRSRTGGARVRRRLRENARPVREADLRAPGCGIPARRHGAARRRVETPRLARCASDRMMMIWPVDGRSTTGRGPGSLACR